MEEAALRSVDTEDALVLARESGADGFISKSTTGPAFVSAVRQWLSETRRPRPPTPGE